VGAGRLDDFLDDLLAGRWTDGVEVVDYVLLLQEAYRADDSIPWLAPKGSKQGNAIHHGEEDFHADVAHFARERKLNLFYVPLMRNGDDREDRGNAILSTFPMSEFAAYELPPQRQRRVTASAMVSGTTAGRPWSVRVINVHLENRGRWKSPLSTLGGARTDQISKLLDAVGMRLEATIMGGDFNVWVKEGNEGAIKLMRSYLVQAGESDPNPTVNPGKKLPERRVDFLFYSRDRDWNVSYERADDRYDSDHYPILIHITPGPADPGEIRSGE
jgi:endonuclease/exonuclease/phosphatase family metal-dependent hydrolase